MGLDNHNSVVLARSGAGKSYLTKLDILRSLYQGVQVLVVDPEQEYARLAEAVGGTVVDLGAPGVRINPFDLPKHAAGTADAVKRRALFVHTVVAVLLGSELTAAERAVLDTAILAAYARPGSPTTPTHARAAPTLPTSPRYSRGTGTPEAASAGRAPGPAHHRLVRRAVRRPHHHRADGHLVVFASSTCRRS